MSTHYALNIEGARFFGVSKVIDVNVMTFDIPLEAMEALLPYEHKYKIGLLRQFVRELPGFFDAHATVDYDQREVEIELKSTERTNLIVGRPLDNALFYSIRSITLDTSIKFRVALCQPGLFLENIQGISLRVFSQGSTNIVEVEQSHIKINGKGKAAFYPVLGAAQKGGNECPQFGVEFASLIQRNQAQEMRKIGDPRASQMRLKALTSQSPVFTMPERVKAFFTKRHGNGAEAA